MFERFTDRSRRVLVLAQEEARLLGVGHIGTEHILLGLIDENEGVAAKVLQELGLDFDSLLSAVRAIVGQGDGTTSPNPPFTPRAKKVLELSLREALQLGHNYIGTEHILLGLVREGEGVGAQALIAKGVDSDFLVDVRNAVIAKLSSYEKTPPCLPPERSAKVMELLSELVAELDLAGLKLPTLSEVRQITQPRQQQVLYKVAFVVDGERDRTFEADDVTVDDGTYVFWKGQRKAGLVPMSAVLSIARVEQSEAA